MTEDFTLTLNGSVQQLSTVLPGAHGPMPRRFVALQPDGGNTHVIYVGSTSGITSSAYGFRLESPVSTIPPAPFVFEVTNQAVDLTEVYVLGTNNEKLHIFCVA